PSPSEQNDTWQSPELPSRSSGELAHTEQLTPARKTVVVAESVAETGFCTMLSKPFTVTIFVCPTAVLVSKKNLTEAPGGKAAPPFALLNRPYRSPKTLSLTFVIVRGSVPQFVTVML